MQVCAVIPVAPLPALAVHWPSKKNPGSAAGTNFGCALPANCCPVCTPVSFDSIVVAPFGRLTIWTSAGSYTPPDCACLRPMIPFLQ